MACPRPRQYGDSKCRFFEFTYQALRIFAKLSPNYHNNGAKGCSRCRRYFVKYSRELIKNEFRPWLLLKWRFDHRSYITWLLLHSTVWCHHWHTLLSWPLTLSLPDWSLNWIMVVGYTPRVENVFDQWDQWQMVLRLVCTHHVGAISLVSLLEDHCSTWEVRNASTVDQG